MSLSVVIVMQTNVGKSKWMEWYLNMKKHNFKLCISHFNFQYAVYFVLSLFVLGAQNHKEIKSLISRCATTCFFGTILQLDAFDGENQNVIFKTPLCCLFVIIYFVGFFLTWKWLRWVGVSMETVHPVEDVTALALTEVTQDNLILLHLQC